MSTISAFQPFITTSIYKPNHCQLFVKPHSSATLTCHRNANWTQNWAHLRLTHESKLTRISSSEEDAPIPESAEPEAVPSDTVAVPVSPADKLIMFFQAEGTMNESAIPTVTQALGGTEGISDLRVYISEGIASVELTKQTTIQATGVASGLVEAIQAAGFKLNTLNLSFEDEELLAAV